MCARTQCAPNELTESDAFSTLRGWFPWECGVSPAPSGKRPYPAKLIAQPMNVAAAEIPDEATIDATAPQISTLRPGTVAEPVENRMEYSECLQGGRFGEQIARLPFASLPLQ